MSDRGQAAVRSSPVVPGDPAAGAGVDDLGDFGAGLLHERGGTASVRAVVREDDGPVAGPDAVALHVGRGGAGEHDPGPVVVGEDDRSLGGAGREHDPARPDVPEPALGVGVGSSLRERSRSRGRRCRAPSSGRGRRRPVAAGIGVDEQDTVALGSRSGRRRRGRAGRRRPRPDDEDLAVGVAACRTGQCRRAGLETAACRPGSSTRSPSSSGTVVARSIGSDAPLGQSTWTSAFGSSAAGRDDPARAVVVDAPADDIDAVRQQRRRRACRRRSPSVLGPIERERDRWSTGRCGSRPSAGGAAGHPTSPA